MNISGKASFDAPVSTVWNALHDPTILKQVIPGCQEMILKENNEYEVILKLGIAAVKGDYTGQVKLEDLEENQYFILNASGSGTPGHVQIKMDCKITATETGCQMNWACEAEIGGMIASVGSRILSGVAKFLADKFFKDLKKELKKLD